MFFIRKSSNISVLSLTHLQAFYLPVDKQKKFLELVNSILPGNTVSVHTLQRLAGKCISFRLAVQDSRLFTNEINLAIGRGLKTSKLIHITPPLRAEIQHWADPSVVARVRNWRSERHHQFVIYSDASLFAWGGLSQGEPRYVDNQALVRAWQSQAARSSSFSDALKELSNTVLSLNLHLSVFYIPSRENPADHPSRRFSPADSNLARHLWLRLQSHPCFGGSDGHSVDLMALESNTQSDGGGVILPHFTPYPTPLSSGVDFFGQDFSQSVSPLANFSGEKGRSRVFAPRAWPTGRWTL